MELGYLVIDMRRLLDESETGRQAAAALERSAVMLFDDAADVTAEVIAAVDANGPLSA